MQKVEVTLRQSLMFAYTEPVCDSSWDLQIGGGQHLFFTISTSDSYCLGTGFGHPQGMYYKKLINYLVTRE